MSANFSKMWLKLSWPQRSSQVTVIMLYSQKGASPVLQCQWPLNLVGLWVRLKVPHLLFQVTCQSSNHMLFEKRHVSTNRRSQNSAGDIMHRKARKSKVFFVIQKILTFDSYRYTLLERYLNSVGKWFTLLFLLYLFWYSVETLSMDIKIINWDSPVQTYIMIIRPVIKENTAHVVVAYQNNVLLLWHTILNCVS